MDRGGGDRLGRGPEAGWGSEQQGGCSEQGGPLQAKLAKWDRLPRADTSREAGAHWVLRVSPGGSMARARPLPPLPGCCCPLCTVATGRQRAHQFLRQRETSGLRTWFPKPLLASKPRFETSGWGWGGPRVAASLEAPRAGGTCDGLFRTTPHSSSAAANAPQGSSPGAPHSLPDTRSPRSFRDSGPRRSTRWRSQRALLGRPLGAQLGN